MAINMDEYRAETYIIHPNVSDVGGLNIGTITLKYRNAIEAGVAAGVMFLFWKIFLGFLSWKVKLIMFIIDLFIVLFFLAGIGSDSVGQYFVKILEFKRSAGHIRYRIPRKEPEKKKRKGKKDEA